MGIIVKPSKSWLILKDPGRIDETVNLFRNCPINITTTGKRHLGAALGTQEYKSSYINEKVDEWCNRLTNLTKIAKSHLTPLMQHTSMASNIGIPISCAPYVESAKTSNQWTIFSMNNFYQLS